MRARYRGPVLACFVAASWAVPSPGGPAPDERTRPRLDLDGPIEDDVLAMQRYCLAELKRAAGPAKGEAARKAALDALVAYMERQRDSCEDMELHGVRLWLSYCLGRARALSGDPNGAYRELDVLLEYSTIGHPPEGRKFVDDLKLRAFYFKAKTAFADEDYDLCIRTVDAMFTPPCGYPWAFSSDAGCAAWMLKARSLHLKEKPDHAAAFAACRKLVQQGRGNWPNNARELMHEVLAAAGRDGTGLALRPEDFSEAALGAYRLALDAKDEDRRRRLLDEAVSLYEKAVRGCRSGGVSLRQRLETEPRAWSAMGICYSKLGLWDEAASSFEGVLVHFSREKVARLLAGSHWPGAGRSLPGTRDVAVPRGRERGLYLALYEELRKDPGLKALLEEHEARLERSAKNLVLACRRRLRESGQPFDEGLLRRARRVAAPFLPHDHNTPGSPDAPAPPPLRGPADADADADEAVF